MPDDRLDIRASLDASGIQTGAAAATAGLRQATMSAEEFQRVLQQSGGDTRAAALGRAFDDLHRSAQTAQTSVAATGQAAESAGAGHDKLRLATAGTTREFVVLGHEAMTGNFSRIPGSIVVLIERMGSLHKITEMMSGAWGVGAGVALAFAAAVGAIAFQAYKAEQAMRGLYNARLAVGGGGAGNVEAMARAGAEAMRSTGMLGERDSKELAAAISKIGILSDESMRKLYALGPALTIVEGGADKAAKFIEETFKNTSSIEAYTKKMGLLSKGEEETFEVAVKSGNAYKVQAIALDAMTRQYSGAGKAINEANQAIIDAGKLAPYGGEYSMIPPSSAFMPSRVPEPEIPVGARPGEVEQRLRWQQEFNQEKIKELSLTEQIAKMEAPGSGASAAMLRNAREQLQQLREAGDPTVLAEVRNRVQKAELEADKAAGDSRSARQATLTAKIMVLENELTGNLRLNNAQKLQLDTELQAARRQLHDSQLRAGTAATKEEYAVFVATERNKLREVRGNAEATKGILQEWETEAATRFGRGSLAFAKAMEQIKAAALEASKVTVAELERMASAMDHAGQDILKGFEATMQAGVKTGLDAQGQPKIGGTRITQQQAYGFDIEEAYRQQTLAKERLDRIMSSSDATPQDRENAYWKQWDLGQRTKTQGQELTAKWAEAGQKAADDFTRPFKTAFDRIGSAFEQAIAGALTGQKNIGQQLARSVATALATAVGSALSQATAHALGGMAGEGIGGLMGRQLVSGITSLLVSLGLMEASTVTTSVGFEAASVAAIELAIALQAAAATESLKSIITLGSGKGGWDVPAFAAGGDTGGGGLAILHPKEMVLPATLADTVRRASASVTNSSTSSSASLSYSPTMNMGGGGSMSRSQLRDMLRDNGEELMSYARTMMRNGWRP